MHPQIEKYLSQVSGQLKDLPAAQRDEEMQELGHHLQSLVVQGKERGLSENEAVKAALAQFGPYRKVGRDLNNAQSSGDITRLPKAFSIMTFVIIGQVMLKLLSYVLLVMPVIWDRYIAALGIGGAIWQISQGLLLVGITVQLALLLRQVRPWAFWMTLFLMSYQGIFATIGFFQTISVFREFRRLSGVQIGLILANQSVFYFSTLFCLSVLVFNRKTYLKMARARWSS